MSKKSSCQQSGQCLNPHFTFQQLRDFTKGLRSLVLLFFCSFMKRKELREGMNRAPWHTWLKMHAISSMTQQIMISRPPHVIEFGSPIWCEMKPCTAGFMIKKRIWYLSSKSKAGYKGLTSGTFLHVSDDQTNCLMHENKCEVYTFTAPGRMDQLVSEPCCAERSSVCIDRDESLRSQTCGFLCVSL